MSDHIDQEGGRDDLNSSEAPTEADSEEKSLRIIEQVKEEAPEVLGAVALGVSFQGPLPPPEMLKQYDDLVPGTAERLIEIHQKEKQHALELQETILEAEREENAADRVEFKRGQFFSLIIVLCILALAAFMTAMGAPTQAATVVTGTVVALVLAFLYGRRAVGEETKSKKE